MTAEELVSLLAIHSLAIAPLKHESKLYWQVTKLDLIGGPMDAGHPIPEKTALGVSPFDAMSRYVLGDTVYKKDSDGDLFLDYLALPWTIMKPVIDGDVCKFTITKKERDQVVSIRRTDVINIGTISSEGRATVRTTIACRGMNPIEIIMSHEDNQTVLDWWSGKLY